MARPETEHSHAGQEILLGQMMEFPLLTTSFIRSAAERHGDAEIVSRSVEGPIHRYTYRDAYARTCRLAHALKRLGVRPGDRVATLAWNGYRHFELYFAISGIGAVCHTINPRLFDDQIAYIVNHAEDRFIFLDLTFVPLLERLAERFRAVDGFVVMTDRAHMPETALPNAMAYEELLAPEDDHYDWPDLDERTAAALCYTSGTTGNPKGALYSHRSTVLHTLSICLGENLALTADEVILPAVPMFHVNAWGIPYGCALSGTKLVLPGARYDGAAIYELLETEGVTIAVGVPTIWLLLIEHMRKNGLQLTRKPRVVAGGSAVPLDMIRAFEEEFDCPVDQGWGMTETSPVGTTGRLKPKIAELPRDERYRYKLAQGRPVWGVEMKIVDAEGARLPHDGEAFGELLVRGPWVINAYFNDPDATAAAFDAEGWFRTGDVASIDPDGTMMIVDRKKDVIKSGGEWISSIELERTASEHPDLAQTAVIGLPHAKWGERPLLVAVPVEGRSPDKRAVIAYLADKVAKWWLPNDVQFIDALPLTATGKVSKLQLRERFQDYVWPEGENR